MTSDTFSAQRILIVLASLPVLALSVYVAWLVVPEVVQEVVQ